MRMVALRVIFPMLLVINYCNTSYVIVCYYTNWSQYRNGLGKFLPSDIDPHLCTHIVYAFAKVNITSYKLNDIEWNDESRMKEVIALKQKNSALKVLLGVGGWNHEKDASPFSVMSETKDGRTVFINSAITMLRERGKLIVHSNIVVPSQYSKRKALKMWYGDFSTVSNGFDGLDLDWEFPAKRKHSLPEDKDRFTLLCKELKERFIIEQKSANKEALLLTSSVAVSDIDKSYNVRELQKYLDFISLLSYDLYGNWNGFTNHHTTLDTSLDFNVGRAVQNWLDKGMSNDKIVLGLATYGQTFKLASKANNQLMANITGPGQPGDVTQLAGILSYYEICSKTWTETVYLSNTKAPYSYAGDQWVSYDNAESISTKVNEIVNKKHLKGVMVWALDFDDFTGSFCKKGKYPLINAAKKALEEQDKLTTQNPKTTTQKPTTTSQKPTTTTQKPTTTTQKSTTTTQKPTTTTQKPTTTTQKPTTTTQKPTTTTQKPTTTTQKPTTTTQKPTTTTQKPTTTTQKPTTTTQNPTITTQKPTTTTQKPTTTTQNPKTTTQNPTTTTQKPTTTTQNPTTTTQKPSTAAVGTTDSGACIHASMWIVLALTMLAILNAF